MSSTARMRTQQPEGRCARGSGGDPVAHRASSASRELVALVRSGPRWDRGAGLRIDGETVKAGGGHAGAGRGPGGERWRHRSPRRLGSDGTSGFCLCAFRRSAHCAGHAPEAPARADPAGCSRRLPLRASGPHQRRLLVEGRRGREDLLPVPGHLRLQGRVLSACRSTIASSHLKPPGVSRRRIALQSCIQGSVGLPQNGSLARNCPPPERRSVSRYRGPPISALAPRVQPKS